MNPHENEHHPQPEPEPKQNPAAEATGAPEAIGAADVAHDPDQTAAGVGSRRARGVDWVRPNDLLARGSGRVSRAAIDFNTYLAQQSQKGIVTGAKWLGAQARKLPHPSMFGRGHDRTGADRSPVGMQ